MGPVVEGTDLERKRNLLADGSRHIQLEETAVGNGRPLQVIAMKTY
jgi:hypothetical protein